MIVYLIVKRLNQRNLDDDVQKNYHFESEVNEINFNTNQSLPNIQGEVSSRIIMRESAPDVEEVEFDQDIHQIQEKTKTGEI